MDWQTIFGDFIGQGTKTPAQIQADKAEQQTTIILYVMLVVVFIVIVYAFLQIFKSK